MNTKDKIVAVVAIIACFVLGGVIGFSLNDTEAKTVESTPKSCIEALDAAEELVQGPVVEITDNAATLAGLVGDAFEAGLYGDEALANEVLAQMEQINIETSERTGRIESLVTQYNAAAENCRGEGGTTT